MRDSCGVFSLAPNGTASRSEEMLQVRLVPTRLVYICLSVFPSLTRLSLSLSLSLSSYQEGRGCLASDMGLFLQKTNILRDFLEDLVEGRAWYPKKEWKEHLEAASAGGTFLLSSEACLSPLLQEVRKYSTQNQNPTQKPLTRKIRDGTI